MENISGILLICMFQLLALFHFSGGTLILELAEEDISVRETSRVVDVVINTKGARETNEPVVLEITPLSIDQYRELGGVVSFVGDQAIPNKDFNATSQTITINSEGPVSESRLEVVIFDDSLSENDEAFVIVLQVVTGSSVLLGRNMTMVLIRTDLTDAENTVVGFNMASLKVNEAMGVVNDMVFVEMEGRAEPELMVELLVTGAGEDMIIFTKTILIPSSTTRVPVPFQLIDDELFEEPEEIRISLLRPNNQTHLYQLGLLNTLTITVEDNDVAHITMATANNSTVLMEGESTELCVYPTASSQLATFIDLKLVRTPWLLTSVPIVMTPSSPTMNFALSGEAQYCITLSAVDDKNITESWTLTFELTLDSVVHDIIPNAHSSIVMTPDKLELQIMDNDGIPQTPSNVKASLINNKDMRIQWEGSPTPLQPVNHYVITMTRQTVNTRVAKRQNSLHDDEADIHGNDADRHDNNVQQFVTTYTEIVVEDVDPFIAYSVEVCAENSLGRTCLGPVSVSADNEVVREAPSIGGQSQEERVFPVWVYGVVGGVLLLVATILVCGCLLCVCCRRSRRGTYYPRRQESKTSQETNEANDQERYKVISSANSLASGWEMRAKEFELIML